MKDVTKAAAQTIIDVDNAFDAAQERIMAESRRIRKTEKTWQEQAKESRKI